MSRKGPSKNYVLIWATHAVGSWKKLDPKKTFRCACVGLGGVGQFTIQRYVLLDDFTTVIDEVLLVWCFCDRLATGVPLGSLRKREAALLPKNDVWQ